MIMPNHIHLLLRIEAKRAIRESPLRADEARSLLAKAVGYLKMNSSKRIHEKHPELQLWQRGYYEYVIRNERDYLEICAYIENNPAAGLRIGTIKHKESPVCWFSKRQQTGELHWFGLKDSLVFQAISTQPFIGLIGFFQNCPTCEALIQAAFFTAAPAFG